MQRYSADIKTKAMGLWADGHTYRKIASELDIASWRTVENWKKAKYPECWDSYAEKLRKNSVALMQNEKLESFEKMLARHQRLYSKLQDKLLALIVKRAEENQLSAKIAFEALMWAAEAERSLYRDLLFVEDYRKYGRDQFSLTVPNLLR